LPDINKPQVIKSSLIEIDHEKIGSKEPDQDMVFVDDHDEPNTRNQIHVETRSFVQ
jgi:hypothetical protein